MKPGDTFSAGDPILEVETDKATIDVEAADDGKLWEILVNEGTSGVPVGKPIAFLAEQDDDLSTLEKPSIEDVKQETQAPAPQEKNPEEKTTKKKLNNQHHVKFLLAQVCFKSQSKSKIVSSSRVIVT